MHEARMPGAAAAGVAFLLGVAAVQWLPSLPPPAWSALPGLIVLWASLRWPHLRLPALVLLGAAWAVWRGTLALAEWRGTMHLRSTTKEPISHRCIDSLSPASSR